MNKGDFDNLIIHLLAIANYAKDIHYNCSGPSFYGDHLFADRFADGIYEYIQNNIGLINIMYGDTQNV